MGGLVSGLAGLNTIFDMLDAAGEVHGPEDTDRLRRRRRAEIRLSGRERDCLAHAARGMASKVIAARLGIAEPTVNLHLDNARRKIGAANRIEAAARAVALGLIEL